MPATDVVPLERTNGVHAVHSGDHQALEGSGAEPEVEIRRRRMPQELRRFLLRVQGGKMYLPVSMRLVWFRDDEETRNWGVETRLLEGGHEAAFATMQAFIYNEEGRLISSDVKTETKQDFPAGWVEKASTGAIGRALAVAGFGTQFDPTLFEYDHDGHVTEAPIKHPDRNGAQRTNGGAPTAKTSSNGVARSPAPSTSEPPTSVASPEAPAVDPELKALRDRLVETARQRGVRTSGLVAQFAPALADKGTSNLTAAELRHVLVAIQNAQ